VGWHSTADAAVVAIRDETARWVRVVKGGNIKVD
jgi:hypothetical protein